MLLHLLFRQRSFVVRNQQTMRKHPACIQIVDTFIIIDLTLHLFRTFVVIQGKHRLWQNRHILILHPSTVIRLVTVVFRIIVGHHNLTVVFHVLIRFLTRLVVRSRLLFRTVLRFNLRFQHLKFVGIRPFQVAHLSSGLRTILVPGQEVGIFFQHRRIVLDSSGIITRTVAQQAPVETGHQVVRLHLEHKAEILNRAVVIPHLCTQQTTVIVSDKIIPVHIQCQVIIRHCPSQVILMISCQRTVDIHARITHRQTNCLRQVRFRILILSALQEQHTARRPCIRIITVHLDSLVRIRHGLQRILLFQRHLRTHQVRIRITRRDTNQRIQIRTCLRIFLLVHPAQSQVMPQTDILRIHLQGLAVILDSPLIILLADT